MYYLCRSSIDVKIGKLAVNGVFSAVRQSMSDLLDESDDGYWNNFSRNMPILTDEDQFRNDARLFFRPFKSVNA